MQRDLPHAGKKLHKTAISESERDDDVGLGQAAGAYVDEREHECGQRKSAETEGCGVGELAALDTFVQTGLEFTTEGRQPIRTRGTDARKWTITEASGLYGGIMLVVAHVGGQFLVVSHPTIGLVVGASGSSRVSGHCVLWRWVMWFINMWQWADKRSTAP